MAESLSGPCDVLIVIAHPDDEIFASGTMCLCAERGFRSALITVTDGERGSDEVYAVSRQDLVSMRRRELALSASMLGISDVAGLGYPDVMDPAAPGPETWDQTRLVKELAETIKRCAPQMIVTHGPMGGYGHLAHRMVHRCVMKAVEDIAYDGSVYAFCGQLPNAFFSWHFEGVSDVAVDARGFLPRRAASLAYHQTQVDFFTRPDFPRTVRKFFSALFGIAFRWTEAGRRRVPIGSTGRFFRLFPIEGLTLHKAPSGGRPDFFKLHFAGDVRVTFPGARRAEGLAHR